MRSHMVNASRQYLESAITHAQGDLEQMRGLPDWAVALVVLCALCFACITMQLCGAILLAPFVVVVRRVRHGKGATRLHDDAAASIEVAASTAASPRPGRRRQRSSDRDDEAEANIVVE